MGLHLAVGAGRECAADLGLLRFTWLYHSLRGGHGSAWVGCRCEPRPWQHAEGERGQDVVLARLVMAPLP